MEINNEFDENEDMNKDFNLRIYLEDYFKKIETEKHNEEKKNNPCKFVRFGIFKSSFCKFKWRKNSPREKNQTRIENENNFKDKEDIILTKYFDIVIRRIEIEKNNYVYDCLFFDVTNIIKSKIKIYEENCKREKILAKMAHEFKTPINSIIGLIGIIKENILNNQQNSESTLNLIENLSKYVLFLISDIVHYLNPLDNHDIKIQKDNISLKESINFCHEILKSLISCNKIKMENIKPEISLDIELDDITVYTDEQRFKQILLNLLSNSVKFTNNGEIKISAEIEKRTSKIIVSVSDTGIGIKDENKNKLFKDYSKINEVNSINKLGDGLGLSICKYLAKKLNIKIQYKSEYGRGTRFDIIFDKKINEKTEKLLNKAYNDINLIPRSINNSSKISEKSSKFKFATNIIESFTSESSDNNNENSKMILLGENTKTINKSSFSPTDVDNNDSHAMEIYGTTSLRNPFFMEKCIGFSNQIEMRDDSIVESEMVFIDFVDIESERGFEKIIENEIYEEKNEENNYFNSNVDFEKQINLIENKEKVIIMIVDDNTIINESLKRLIDFNLQGENIQYEIIMLNDGFDILKVLLTDDKIKENLRFIFTDENMDFLNGSDAISLVRLWEKIEKRNKINIISITCHEDPKIVNQIISKGADQVLAKPITKSLIKTTLKKFGLIK